MNIQFQRCDILDILSNVIMFTSHILIMHLLSHGIDKEGVFLNKTVLKSILYTIISMCIYHLLVKKLIPIKQIKKSCYVNNYVQQ
jgi:hypothetical protein